MSLNQLYNPGNGYPKQVQVGEETVTVNNPMEEVYAQQARQTHIRTMTGMPDRPEFDYMIDESTGLMKDQYNLTDQMDTGALDKYKSEAMRDPGQASQWAQMMQNQLKSQEAAAQDGTAKQIAGGRAGMLSDLASTGGLTGGARERAMMSGGRDAMLAKQNTRREFGDRGMQVGIQDEQNRQSMLQNSVGMDSERAKYLSNIQDTNANRALGEINQRRQDDLSAWDTKLSTWASSKQADAQAAANNNSCFHPDTLIQMQDGTKKKIRDIKLGERVLLGGEVTNMIIGKHGDVEDTYNYAGVFVTGNHAVREDGRFIRVRNSRSAEKANLHIPVVYNLVTENHVMVMNEVIFGDYQETDIVMSDEDSIKELNVEFGRAIN